MLLKRRPTCDAWAWVVGFNFAKIRTLKPIVHSATSSLVVSLVNIKFIHAITAATQDTKYPRLDDEKKFEGNVKLDEINQQLATRARERRINSESFICFRFIKVIDDIDFYL